jgi:spore coat protein H
MNNYFLWLLLVLFVSCRSELVEDQTVPFAVPDWTDASHGKNATPDYQIVFPQDKVNALIRFITLSTKFT